MTTQEKATMSIKETAAMLGINTNTVYAWLQTGKLPARKNGKLWMISRKQISEWLDNAPSR